MSEIPAAKPRNQGISHTHAAHITDPNMTVIIPSKAVHPQLGNLSEKAEMARKRPITVKTDANTNIHVTAPAAG